jgi:hypothetical protein
LVGSIRLPNAAEEAIDREDMRATAAAATGCVVASGSSTIAVLDELSGVVLPI